MSRLALSLLVFFGLAQAAFGADAAIADFFGRWSGGGTATSGTPGALFQTRDTEVVIQKRADGFRIEWTTMQMQNTEPTRSVVKPASLSFRKTASPLLFHGVEGGNPLAKDGQVTWAKIAGQTLRVVVFSVEPEGKWNIATYDRTLTGPKAMTASFTRVIDGELKRKAELTLTKAD